MMILPVNRLVRHVAEGVIHPAHVPLEAKAKTTRVDRTGDAGECGGFLRDHHDPRIFLVADLVELLQEFDRLNVLATTIPVRDPLPFFP